MAATRREVVQELYDNLHGEEFVPPVQSLMDMDFYKLNMMRFIRRFYPDETVTFKLIVRDKTIPLWHYVDKDEFLKSLDFAMGLRYRKTDLRYLRGMNLFERDMFDNEDINFLQDFKLPQYNFSTNDGVMELTFSEKWGKSSPWETLALAILSELYYRGILRKLKREDFFDVYAVADAKLQKKLHLIQKHPRIIMTDFSQRRRNSFLWHKYVVGECKRQLGKQFTGTSDTWMAFHHDLEAIGTYAHELVMVLTALANSDEEMRYAQYLVMELWQKLFGTWFPVFLPDTYGSEQFYKNAPAWVTNWKGQRQDSGDPIVEGERYIKWLREHDIDPKERMTIFSDGLNIDSMIAIDDHFSDRHPHPYGWGTMLTNDFEDTLPSNEHMRPFSVVCKVVDVNGRPCVKLSNNPSKATGPKEEIARYLKVFGSEGMTAQKVFV